MPTYDLENRKCLRLKFAMKMFGHQTNSRQRTLCRHQFYTHLLAKMSPLV